MNRDDWATCFVGPPCDVSDQMQSMSRRIVLSMACLIAVLTADIAAAQFTGPIKPPNLPTNPGLPTNTGNVPQNASPKTVQQMMMLRYLQQRSGGGVKRGTPQFIPFGNQGFMGPQALPTQQDAAQTPPVASSKKSSEEKKAEYQAAREEKKKQARERAEKRKAARSQGSAASGSGTGSSATGGSKDPA